MFSDDRTMFGVEPWSQCPNADVLQLHWVAGFLDYGAFFRWLPEKTRLVWTLHDMNAFTGGCHYDAGCGRFTQGCGACPALGSRQDEDLSAQVWRRKQKSLEALPAGKLHIVTPSRWLAEQAKRSALLSRFPRSVIPYGLDTDVFRPRDPHAERERLGIPLRSKVILFLADGVSDPRKGCDLLLQALAGITDSPDLFLLTLGRGEPVEFRGFPHVHLDAVADDSRLSSVYSAADVFVAPSLQDNLPNTVLESMACGTPVVAHSAGGIPEAVRQNETGFLVPSGDVAELGSAIRRVLENDSMRADMSRNCRRIATAEYAIDIQARRYVTLYTEIASTGAPVFTKASVGGKSEEKQQVTARAST